jgi:hypothetical protein
MRKRRERGAEPAVGQRLNGSAFGTCEKGEAQGMKAAQARSAAPTACSRSTVRAVLATPFRWLALLLVLAAVAAGCRGGGGQGEATAAPEREAATAPTASLDGERLVSALRGGGYVIYLRHAATEAAPDEDPVVLSDCDTQRNLSAEGRTSLRAPSADVQ